MKKRDTIWMLGTLFLFTGWANLWGQRVENGQWLSAKVSQEYKDLKWSVEQNLRFRYGLAVADNYFIESGIRNKFSKHFSLAGKYRLGWKDLSFNPSLYHRFNLDAQLSNKWKKIDLKVTYRPRIQVRLKPEEGRLEQTWYIRNKVTVEKKLYKKVNAYTGTELFTNLNDSEQGILNDEYRVFAGVEVKIAKRQQIECFYMMSNEFNVAAPSRTHILGLGYKYQLKKLKRKKKKQD